ncbi:FapA family protein [Selenomonas sp. AB3002]|uniref:DUF342 domain-containing protein n=1 Tax=Selenomonas sp. AB3002 TaxID=1392502 RepID=UPI000495708F
MAEKELRSPVGGAGAGYLLEFRETGVYITIFPDSNGILFELSDIRQILQECGVVDYDVVSLARIVRESSGEAHKLSDSFLSPEEMKALLEGEKKPEGEAAEEAPLSEEEAALAAIPADIIVEISRDRMQATVRFDTRKGKGLRSVSDIQEALEAKKVVFGINLNAIKKGAQALNPFVAAQGVPPQHGENAVIERKFDLGVKGRPVIDKYDRVDYKNLNLFVLVKKGDVLAVRIPQTQGVPGRNVLGAEVMARNGRPLPLPLGKGTAQQGENTVIAAIDGQIVDSKNKIAIDPHLVIKSSVGVGTGNIDFDGSVEIKGNVEAGFMVKATGDIEIGGVVSGGDVHGRNVFVSGGVNGMGRGQVTADADVRVSFAENARIEAGQDIYISDVSLHSNIRAGRHIYVEDRRGQITGGLAAAGEEIRANVIGNQACVVTNISVGIDPTLQNKYNHACNEYKETKKRLTEITQMLNTLSKIDVSKLPPQRVEQINSLTRSQFPLVGKLKRQEAEIAAMAEELSHMKNGKVSASSIIYPGVRITINSLKKNIQSELQRCTLTVQGDEVTVGLYDG